MGKIPVKLKAVVYTLSLFQQKVMSGLWKDLPGTIHHKVSENWISATLLLAPLIGTCGKPIRICFPVHLQDQPEFTFWNASRGADHFYVCCDSVGREAASKHHDLHNNAIQFICSSSYFQRLYITHKDVGLPQVWPRPYEKVLNPPDARHRLVFFAGRMQNSRIHQELIASWGNDTYMDIFSGSPSMKKGLGGANTASMSKVMR